MGLRIAPFVCIQYSAIRFLPLCIWNAVFYRGWLPPYCVLQALPCPLGEEALSRVREAFSLALEGQKGEPMTLETGNAEQSFHTCLDEMPGKLFSFYAVLNYFRSRNEVNHLASGQPQGCVV